MPWQRRGIRIFGWVLAAMAAALFAAWAALHVHTERLLQGEPLWQPAAALPHGDPARGERLGRILGCSGCHGEDLGGRVFADIPHIVRLVATNLTVAAAATTRPGSSA